MTATENQSNSPEFDRSRFRVGFITMGCAKNEVDTRNMSRLLRDSGYLICDSLDACDVIVINTCSFIQTATEESIEAIFDTLNDYIVKSSNIPVIISGCMPARYGDEIASEIFEASAFVPCDCEQKIVSIVDDCLRRATEGIADTSAITGSLSDADDVTEFRSSFDMDPTDDNCLYAYVKISDGCDRWCSYCTIPIIRGRYHSFPYTDIRDEVACLVGQGKREIVLIAQDTGRWGCDLPDFNGDALSLSWLIEKLAQEFPNTWFRVMYIQPEGITDDLLRVIAQNDNVCNYLDIPLQHVSHHILKAMNRKGDRQEFEDLIVHIRKVIPDITLRTTLIAGFPGESDEDFDELVAFVEESEFDYIGVFPFSPEEGTVAFGLEGRLDPDECEWRALALRDVADAVCSAKIAGRIGDEMPLLVEAEEEDGQLVGRVCAQAPEVDGVTFVDKGSVGQIIAVRICDTQLYDMEASSL